MATIHRFGPTPITCHSWSGDRGRVALSQNSKEVDLYQSTATGGWEKEAKLDQHDLRVTGIDWAPKTNRIVTCSADRNAYVWVKGADGCWKHTLVVLRINRAATCVRWSPDENKFAIGSGAKIVNICYYDSEYDWWVAKHIKKPLKSTVTTVDWHPNNVLLAAGSTDFKVRVYSGYIKEIEGKPSTTEWGAKMSFGNIMAEFNNSANGGGWIHSVCFSGDGSKVAWVGHDSSVNVADAANGMKVSKLLTKLLPLLSIVWIGPSSLVAAGHNYVPITFNLTAQGDLVEGGKLEEEKKTSSGPMSNAMKMFQNMDVLGQSNSGAGTTINTIHGNQINEIRVYGADGASASKISTCGGDGKLVVWDLRTLADRIKHLKI